MLRVHTHTLKKGNEDFQGETSESKNSQVEKMKVKTHNLKKSESENSQVEKVKV